MLTAKLIADFADLQMKFAQPIGFKHGRARRYRACHSFCDRKCQVEVFTSCSTGDANAVKRHQDLGSHGKAVDYREKRLSALHQGHNRS